MDVIKKLGPVELTRCAASPTCGRAIKPKGTRGQPRAVGLQPLRQAALPALLQDLHREGVGRARPPRSAPSGPPSGSRACRSSRAAKAAFFGNKGNKIKSLIDEFHYPRFGPGQMWETMTDEIIASTAARCGSTRRSPSSRSRDGRGRRASRPAASASSPSRRDLVAAAARRRSAWPARRRRARSRAPPQGLRYRDFLTVALVIDGEDLFPDNWIYIHDPSVSVGRIQNFRSWSPWMVPDQSKACVGLEYFCFEGDELWDDGRRRPRRARPSASSSSSASAERREGRARLRRRACPKAYPMYDADYAERVDDDPRLARRASTTSSRSAATACTATTTRTTRCSPRCARWTTSSTGTDHDIWAVNAESRRTTRSTRGAEQPVQARARDAARCASRSSPSR